MTDIRTDGMNSVVQFQHFQVGYWTFRGQDLVNKMAWNSRWQIHDFSTPRWVFRLNPRKSPLNGIVFALSLLCLFHLHYKPVLPLSSIRELLFFPQWEIRDRLTRLRSDREFGPVAFLKTVRQRSRIYENEEASLKTSAFRLWVRHVFIWILSRDSGIINTQRLPLWNLKRNGFEVMAFVCQTGGSGKVMQ